MQEIDLSNYPRKKTYDWFKTFKNPTYGLNVTMDITKLIKHVKETKESFFIDMLYSLNCSINYSITFKKFKVNIIIKRII